MLTILGDQSGIQRKPEPPYTRSGSILPIGHLVLAAVVAGLGSTISYSAPAPIGKTVQATSTVRANGSAGARVLGAATPVYFMDSLRSNATGVGQFEFVDGTKLVIGPNATILVDRFVYKGGRTVQQLGIQATKGAFRWISGKSRSTAYKVSTPYGTMGIRGTAFDFTVRNGKTYLVLLKGNVRYCNGGSCQVLRRACDFIVAGGGKVSKPDHLAKLMDSREASQIFPLLANQGRLASTFRQPSRSCLSRVVRFQPDPRMPAATRAFAAPEPPAPGPAPEPRGNNGFGNGPEGSEAAADASNPGRGKGGPHRAN